MQNSSKRLVTSWLAVGLILGAMSMNRALGDESAVGAGLRVVENPDGFLVTELGQTVLQYQLRTKSLDGRFARSNYVHPLNDLDGDCITEDFPEDHKHHRGIFWAWHQVWVGEQKIGDPWLCENFEWVTQSRGLNYNADKSVTVSATVIWQSLQLLDDAQQPVPIAEESVEITVFPQAATYRVVEFRLSFRALLPDVRIGGSEDEKGYGGFSPRIKLNQNQKFVSAGREIEPVKNAIEAGPWVDIADQKVGVAMLTHPRNPGSPEAWILRRSRSMQNVRFPGPNAISLPAVTPLVQRYQLIIHRGDGSVDLEQLQQKFADSAD